MEWKGFPEVVYNHPQATSPFYFQILFLFFFCIIKEARVALVSKLD